MPTPWTPEEDDALKALVAEHGKKWNFISVQLPNRSPTQVASRWEKCLNPLLTKGCFTEEEDRIITDHVANDGPRHWPVVSARLQNRRSPKQCRERWLNHLAPQLNSSPWTAEEDARLLEEFNRRGPHWVIIAKELNGRSENAVKNRWNSSVKLRLQTDERGVQTLRPEEGKRPVKPLPPLRTPPLVPQSPILLPTSLMASALPKAPGEADQLPSGTGTPASYLSPGFYSPGCWTPPPISDKVAPQPPKDGA
jgi:hypothetical protein